MPETDIYLTTSLTSPERQALVSVTKSTECPLDVSNWPHYWPKLDQSSDVHRTSLGRHDSMSISNLSWNMSMMFYFLEMVHEIYTQTRAHQRTRAAAKCYAIQHVASNNLSGQYTAATIPVAECHQMRSMANENYNRWHFVLGNNCKKVLLWWWWWCRSRDDGDGDDYDDDDENIGVTGAPALTRGMIRKKIKTGWGTGESDERN